jgi:hypothetical protein
VLAASDSYFGELAKSNSFSVVSFPTLYCLVEAIRICRLVISKEVMELNLYVYFLHNNGESLPRDNFTFATAFNQIRT